MFYVREEKGLERIVKSVGNLLQINDDASLIVQYIKERTSKEAVVFLTELENAIHCYGHIRC